MVVWKASDCFRLAGGIGSVYRPVIAVQFGFLIFFQLVRVIISGEAFRSLVACQLPAQALGGNVLGGMAFLFSVYYRVAVAFRAVRIFKFLAVNLHVDAFLFALLADIPEKLCKGYIVALYFDRIVCHGVGLLKDMFDFCE